MHSVMNTTISTDWRTKVCVKSRRFWTYKYRKQR